MSERLTALPHYLVPKQALTEFAGIVAGARLGRITTGLICWFVGRYGVNMGEAANADPGSYATFNEFFTRPLLAGARPLADADYICPVDGTISQAGPIEGDQIYQAKGHRYSTTALVGGDPELAARFQDGSFATLYLSPKDYHRIHMPCDGHLTRMIYVPGTLFSVNPATARAVPGLFARNERVVCVFNGANGPFVLTLVGATIVGSMATVWQGVINPPRTGKIREWTFDDQPVPLRKGDEMGRFLLGSTVVLLYPQGAIEFNKAWVADRSIRMGENMGSRALNAPSPTSGRAAAR